MQPLHIRTSSILDIFKTCLKSLFYFLAFKPDWVSASAFYLCLFIYSVLFWLFCFYSFSFSCVILWSTLAVFKCAYKWTSRIYIINISRYTWQLQIITLSVLFWGVLSIKTPHMQICVCVFMSSVLQLIEKSQNLQKKLYKWVTSWWTALHELWSLQASSRKKVLYQHKVGLFSSHCCLIFH